MSHGQIVSTVLAGKVQLQWPGAVPPALAALGVRRLSHGADARPSFSAVGTELEAIAADLAAALPAAATLAAKA